jgi:hypothetical protein
MDLVKLKTQSSKEVCAVKLFAGYHGVVIGDDEIYVTNKAFRSPLHAANAARKLKKEHKIIKNIKKKNDTINTIIQTKICRVKKLYSEAEVSTLKHLRFREAWVILSPGGEYVRTVLTQNRVVDYCSNRDQAKTFKTYEEASDFQKTLNRVVKTGHCLRRFFVESN